MSPSAPVGYHPWPKAPTTWRDGKVLRVSVPYTWNLPSVREFCMQASMDYDQILLGGPAVYLLPQFFKDLDHVTIGAHDPTALQHVYPRATRTTVGCPNKCPFCAVPAIGEPFRELDDWPDRPVLIDDNLLAASVEHFDKVMDRLEAYDDERVDFNQGLDARLLTRHHAERFARLWKPILRLACDSRGVMPAWEEAFDRLRAAGIPKYQIRSFALVGFRTDPREAWDRCEWVEAHGVKVQPGWYTSLDAMAPNQVTLQQEQWGWNDYERRRIMQWFYRHKRAKKYRRKRSKS
jgi:hypothetical protein